MSRVMQSSFYKRSGLPGLERIEVRHKFSNHTVGLLDYRISSRQSYYLPPENTPVQFIAGEGPDKARVTYGYVNHYETATSDEDGSAITRMVVIGTSKMMNSASPQGWQNQTRSTMVRDIARKYRLRSVTHTHPYVVDNWTTGTRTDFQALKVLADETGYRLWVDGGTVWFLDPEKLLLTASTMTTPVVTTQALRGSVQVMGGSNIPGEMQSATRRIQYGLDYRTNEFFSATSGDEARPVKVAGQTVTTFEEAQQSADAAERTQRDFFVVKATFDGNANIVPGSLTRLASGRVNTDQGGLWLTTEVDHTVTKDDFVTRYVGTRGEQQKPLPSVPSTVRGTTGAVQALVRTNNRWEAALQEHVHV